MPRGAPRGDAFDDRRICRPSDLVPWPFQKGVGEMAHESGV
jgi:hypothetical protein